MDTQAQLEKTYEALGITTAEDKLKDAIPAAATVVTLGIGEFDGVRRIWAEKSFATDEAMRDALASQAGDRDDPNPLPAACVEFALSDRGIQLCTLNYNAVSGLDVGFEFEILLDASSADSAAAGAEFLDELFRQD
jgi:hypothetical protein